MRYGTRLQDHALLRSHGAAHGQINGSSQEAHGGQEVQAQQRLVWLRVRVHSCWVLVGSYCNAPMYDCMGEARVPGELVGVVGCSLYGVVGWLWS